MRTVFLLAAAASLPWRQFVALLERHRITRLIDVRSIPESRRGPFNQAVLGTGMPDLWEPRPDLCPFESWELPQVRRELKELLNTSCGARLCFLCAPAEFHLTPLVRGLGWRVFRIAGDGHLVEDAGQMKTPGTAVKRAPGASHHSLQQS